MIPMKFIISNHVSGENEIRLHILYASFHNVKCLNPYFSWQVSDSISDKERSDCFMTILSLSLEYNQHIGIIIFIIII